MFPLAFLGIIGLLTMFAIKSNRPSPTKQLTTPAVSSGKRLPPSDPTRNLKLLRRVISAGKAPQKWLVNEAMREAYDRRDWDVVGALSTAFCTPSNSESSPSGSDSSDSVSGSDSDDSGETPTDVGKLSYGSSQLDGVSDDEWITFVDALKTEAPGFKSGKHVGAWHHNTERLSQLGIAPESLAGEAEQYAALTKDLQAYHASERQLIRDVCGDLVTLNGTSHPVTMSGVLALLKAAGPKNTRAWFRSESDRSSFPKTAETFLKANGIF